MKHRFNGYKCILLFDLKAQLLILLQNVSEVNRVRSRHAAASRVCDSGDSYAYFYIFKNMHNYDKQALNFV